MICEVCGELADSPLDFLYWPSDFDHPMGDGTRHSVHPSCTEVLLRRLNRGRRA